MTKLNGIDRSDLKEMNKMFDLVEELLFRNEPVTSFARSGKIHRYKITDEWMEERSKGKSFEIREDNRECVPIFGDIVILESPSKIEFTRVNYVLCGTVLPELLKENTFLMELESI